MTTPPPEETGKIFTLALALHEAGWLDKAADSYRAVLRTDPRHAGAHHLLGLLLLEQQKLPEAVASLRAAVANGGDTVRLFLALASALRTSADLFGAAESGKRAIALDPANPDLLSWLGNLLREDKRFAEATAVLRRALAAKPGDPALLGHAAAVLQDMGDAAAAEQVLRQGLAADDSSAELHLKLAEALSAQNRPDDALDSYDRAIARRAGSFDAHFGRAAALAALGRREEAAQALRDAAATASEEEDRLRVVRRLFDLGFEEDAATVYCPVAAATQDRKRFPGADARSLTIRPAAAVCAARGWSYRRVTEAQPLRLPTWDGDELVMTQPEIFLARVEDAEIVPSNHTVVAGGDSLVLDGLSTHSRASLALVPHFVAHAADDRVLLDLPPPVQTIEEEVILLGGTANWSHGVLDYASKLAVLERFPELEGLPVLVAPNTLGSILDLFEMLGVARGRMRRLPAGEVVRARRLWLPSLTHFYQLTAPVHVEFLRRRLSGLIAEGMARPRRRIFLSRRQAGYRMLLNEAEVLAALAPFGVEPVVPEEFSMAEQVRLFASAELIVGPIGGGSAAVAFAPPDAAYVELVHRRIALPQYRALTAVIGQRYRQIVGPMRGNRGPSEFDYDFAVPPDEVVAAVRALLPGA